MGYGGDSNHIANVAGQHHEMKVTETLTSLAEREGQVWELQGDGLGRGH